MATRADRAGAPTGETTALSGDWRVLPERSHVGFRMRTMGMYFVRGRFAGVRGRVELDADGIPRRGEVEIKSASVSTRMPPRDWHLRTGEFLAASRHPCIRASAEGIEPAGDGALRVPAVLEIRGIRRPVPLIGHVHEAGDVFVLLLLGILDRHDVDVRPRRPFEWIVGREVHLDVELVLRRTA